MKNESCKVLVVDDERDNANTIVSLLQLWGHEAEAAYSGEDAISKALTLDPDVVLIDIVMPEMNGFDLAKELRQVCPGAKFLALTGFTRSRHRSSLSRRWLCDGSIQAGRRETS